VAGVLDASPAIQAEHLREKTRKERAFQMVNLPASIQDLVLPEANLLMRDTIATGLRTAFFILRLYLAVKDPS
jgi:hypothetical protein